MLDFIKAQLQATVPFAAHVGVLITIVECGRAEATLDERPEVTNHIATIHAGALFTLAEAASGAAMAGALAPVLMQVRPVASHGAITYRKPAKGPLVARAQVSRTPDELIGEIGSVGKTAFDVAVSIVDAEGTEVATVDVGWHVRTHARAA